MNEPTPITASTKESPPDTPVDPLPEASVTTAAELKQRRIEQRQHRKDLGECLKRRIKQPYELLVNNADFLFMRRSYSKRFFEVWKIGFEAYVGGKWDIAKKTFQQTLVTSDLLTSDHVRRQY